MNNKIKKENKGFTLVELIVVLVILAILAAILVPTLLGYIDKARGRKDVMTAEAYKQACQSVLSKLYGLEENPNYDFHNALISSDSTSYTWDTDYRKEILKLVGEASPDKIDSDGPNKYEPYVIIYQVGRYPVYKGTDNEKYAYTVFNVYYQKEQSSELIILTQDGVQSVQEFAADRSAGKNGGRDWVIYNGEKVQTVVYCGEIHAGSPTEILGKIENGTYQ